MVTRLSNKAVTTYEVFDERGHSVGCVILPRSPRVVGPSEGTVFLHRPKGARPPRAPRPADLSRKAS